MRILLLIFGLFMVAIGANAQTTLEEYNYLTKGYKIQIESGLDMKSGYQFFDLVDQSTRTRERSGRITRRGTTSVERELKFKGLYRDGEDAPCAILIIYERLDNGFQDYICVPHIASDEEIWQLFKEKINGYSSVSGLKTLVLGVSKAMAYFAQEE